jgi:hypothetical protein
VTMPIPTPRELWLLHKWSPLLGYLRRLSETLDARERAVIVSDATEWVSSQVKAPTLGRLASKLSAVMRTPEGVELVREAVLVGDKLVASMEQTP